MSLVSSVKFCPNCGLTQKNFEDHGVIGCPLCPQTIEVTIPPKQSPVWTGELKRYLVPSRGRKRDIFFRFRLSRSHRRGFLPFWDRQKERSQSLARIYKNFGGSGSFIPVTEDHFRVEWKSKSPWSAREIAFWRNEDLWAKDPRWGFLNSCPTNWGLGNRFSLRFSLLPEEESVFPAYLRHKESGLAEISWKNLDSLQNQSIRKILGLLEFSRNCKV